MTGRPKPWQRPKLIILARSEPAESVLRVCKERNFPFSAWNVVRGCEWLFCFNCNQLVTS